MSANTLTERTNIIRELVPQKVWILNKQKVWQKLTPNAVQRDYIEHKTHRSEVLKSRRMGISTWELGEDVVGAAYYGERTMLIAQNRDAARNLLLVGQQMADRFPKSDKIVYDKNNTSIISFKNSGGFVIIGTSRTPDFPRSFTLDRVHWTEPAMASDEVAYELYAALNEAASHGTFSMESTAKGASGLFYEKVIEAKRLQDVGLSGEWRLHFYAWWWGEDNELAGWDWSRLGPLTDEEAMLTAEHKLRAGQIAWRRAKIADLPRGLDQFYEEYPESVEGAFLAAGGSFFPAGLTKLLFEHCTVPLYIREDKMEQWELPRPECYYSLGADCGGGGEARIETGGRSELDTSAVVVLCLKHLNVVATWQGLLPPEAFGTRLVEWAKLYNNAFVAPERNGFGATVCRTVLDLGYSNIYVEEDTEGSVSVGWHNSYAVRPAYISAFREGLLSGALRIQQRALVQEMTTFTGRLQPSGEIKYQAPRGASDDLIWAAIGAWQFKEFAPSPSMERQIAWRPRKDRWGNLK